MSFLTISCVTKVDKMVTKVAHFFTGPSFHKLFCQNTKTCTPPKVWFLTSRDTFFGKMTFSIFWQIVDFTFLRFVTFLTCQKIELCTFRMLTLCSAVCWVFLNRKIVKYGKKSGRKIATLWACKIGKKCQKPQNRQNRQKWSFWHKFDKIGHKHVLQKTSTNCTHVKIPKDNEVDKIAKTQHLWTRFLSLFCDMCGPCFWEKFWKATSFSWAFFSVCFLVVFCDTFVWHVFAHFQKL